MNTSEILRRIEEDVSAKYGSATCTAANTSPGMGMTAQELLIKMEGAMQRMKVIARGFVPPVYKISPYATMQVLVRQHKKRRSQTEAYHRRVQKKWTKRFGMKHTPAAYLVNGGFLWSGQSMLVIHPSLARQLEAHADRPSPPRL